MRGGILDTNVLLYAVNSDCPEHGTARAFLERVMTDPSQWYLTEGICYEFLRVATHHRVFPKPLAASDALTFLETLFRSPNISLISAGKRHWLALRGVMEGLHAPSGNLFFDVRTATLMREHGIPVIHTADTDFLKFRDLHVLNPLVSQPS